jgi:hypothetical protein
MTNLIHRLILLEIKAKFPDNKMDGLTEKIMDLADHNL